MDENRFDSSITADLSAAAMQRLYAVLDDEAVPFEMTVRRMGNKKRVIIRCDAKYVTHFNRIVANENKTEI